MSITITVLDEQQERDRYWFMGVDFGSKIKVLAFDGERELWWRTGYTGWLCRGQTKYYKPVLCLVSLKDPLGGIDLVEGGRLSKAMFKQHAAEIDAFFGTVVAKHLHPRKTVRLR